LKVSQPLGLTDRHASVKFVQDVCVVQFVQPIDTTPMQVRPIQFVNFVREPIKLVKSLLVSAIVRKLFSLLAN
jgi:hypothetical protein